MLQGRAEGTVFFPQNFMAAKHSFPFSLLADAAIHLYDVPVADRGRRCYP